MGHEVGEAFAGVLVGFVVVVHVFVGVVGELEAGLVGLLAAVAPFVDGGEVVGDHGEGFGADVGVEGADARSGEV